MKPTPMSLDVRTMIDARHSAEQRGLFSPLGRLLWMQTEHGTIQFPAVDGVDSGPDIGQVHRGDENPNPADGAFLVLGTWVGLPALRSNTTKPCPSCRHACDVCDGSGKKLCELCGGQGWVAGGWLPCGASGCTKETGQFKADCSACRGTGQTVEHRKCSMCDGSKLMTCPRCSGTGKFSTGRINGSIDWTGKKCTKCDGTCFAGKWKPQDLKRFTNARLRTLQKAIELGRGLLLRGEWLVLGPILTLGLRHFESMRGCIFDVLPDGHGDMLMLIVPATPKQLPQKAFLVGGVVRPRQEMRSA
jgi:hypothetical protein